MKTSMVLLLLLCLPGVALASEKPKLPKPSITLKKVVRALAKSKNYAIDLSVIGGFANGKDHKITRQQANYNFSANYYHGYMEHTTPRIFRTSKSGAIEGPKGWMQLLAVAEGAQVSRLFEFPQAVLLETLKKGTTVEWVGGRTEMVFEKGKGSTGVAKEVVIVPNRLRVELPSKLAIKRYTTIQNSGCTSEG